MSLSSRPLHHGLLYKLTLEERAIVVSLNESTDYLAQILEMSLSYCYHIGYSKIYNREYTNRFALCRN